MPTEPTTHLVESLAPIYQLESLEGWHLLKRHFELTEGFSFVVVVAPDDWGIALLRSFLPKILPANTNWQRVVFDPAAPFERLSEQLLELKETTSLIWIDADPGEVAEPDSWDKRRNAWKRALTRLNRYRNTFQARIQCTLALAGPARLMEVVRESAPDLWAIRSGVFRIEPPGLSRLTIKSMEVRQMFENEVGDPTETLAEAEKVRGKPGRESILINVLLRASSQAASRLLWDVAIRCLEEAYTLAQTYGADPQVRLDLEVELSVVYLRTAQFDRGLLYAKRTRETAERFFGPDAPQTAKALSNLALVLKETNRLAEAEPLMRVALAIDEQSFGPDDPRVAVDLTIMAELMYASNRVTEAEPLIRRALAIDEQRFGINHPNISTDLNNLAQLLEASNRLPEAEALMRRALAIDEQRFGKDHPNVAIRLSNLARLLWYTNRLAEAEPLMRRTLEIVFQGTSPTEYKPEGSNPKLRVVAASQVDERRTNQTTSG